MSHVLINGRMLPEEEALIPVQDRGFRYGDGAFETIAVHGGAPYRFSWHVGRLAHALATIRINADVSSLESSCLKLIAANELTEGLLRIQVTRGSGGRGYLPAASAAPTIVIETLPLPKSPSEPVNLWLSSYQKIALAALPIQSKLCQGLNSTLARMEARENGCFEALQLNSQGEICETSSANIFWVQDGVLYTPAIDCGVLEGSVRSVVIALSPQPVYEVHAGIEALESAEAVFITNSSWKILPVAALKPQDWYWNSASAAKIWLDRLTADIAHHRELEPSA